MRYEKPFIGVLCWEEGGNPKGLEQLESLPGNSVNPESYPFPVIFRRVKGANYNSVLHNPHSGILDVMVSDGMAMVEQGVRAIITSCGFNAIFQKKLAKALPVPVFTSTLIQIPFILSSIGCKKLAVITASKQALKPAHFGAVGVEDMSGIEIYGMDEQPEWSKIHLTPDQPLSIKTVEKEVISTAVTAQKEIPELGAILLECTDLPPFAPAIREAVKVPVYDLSTMITLIHASFFSSLKN
jgi:hypothetical protein